MRILRVELSDYRGIVHADVAMEPDGVTVIEGPNEAGKSCLAEAIGLVRRYQDSSRAREVLDVKPTAADAGPQVEIEIRTGDYHFVYRKRFVKRPRTELEITAPRREQLTGRDAHDRVEEIFEETLDSQLWDALQMIQGQSFQQPLLAKIEPLRSALGEARGESQQSGGHQDVLEAIDAEYARYFTPTGRPTGQYASAISERERLAGEADRLTSELQSVDGVLEQFEANRARLEEIAREEQDSARQLRNLQDRASCVADLRDRVRRVAADREQAAQRHDRAVADEEARDELRADVERRTATQAQAEAAATEAAERLHALQHEIDDAFERAERDAEQAAVRDDEHRLHASVLQAARDRRELDVLCERTKRAIGARRDRSEARARLEGQPLGESAVAELLELQTALVSAEAARDAAAARVHVERLGTAAVEVDGVRLEEAYDAPVSQESTITAAGVVSVRVTPGHDPRELNARARDARAAWDEALERHGVASLDEARCAAARRADDAARLGRAENDLAQALGDDDLEAMQARCTALRERLSACLPGGGLATTAVDGGPEAGAPGLSGPGPADAGPADAGPADERDGTGVDLEAAEQREALAAEAAAQAREAAEGSRAQAQQADRSAADLRTELARLRQQATGSVTEIKIAEQRLETARAARPDAALHDDATSALERVRQLQSEQSEAEAALAEEHPDDLQVLLENERSTADRHATDRRTLEDAQQHLRGRLADVERRGLRDQHDAISCELRDVERALERTESRAAAARLLRETMSRHLAASQERYVAPFRDAVERLGRIVFGGDFAVEVTPDLAIESRTLHGVTVPFASLSGGAKEQLAVIGRLACAQLVSEPDGAPVVLDDSLGFSDPTRLRRLAAVLNEVGHRAQIIILTCQPERFGAIGEARVVRLTAAGDHRLDGSA